MSESTAFEQLKTAIERHEAVAGVIGLGYVGLPLVPRLPGRASRRSASTSIRRRLHSSVAGESYISHFGADRIADMNVSGMLPRNDRF